MYNRVTGGIVNVTEFNILFNINTFFRGYYQSYLILPDKWKIMVVSEF